ncbi:J domain-containing protein [Paenibacillus sp. GCM10027627]|uniref:J domain-containing protein n=1 Tax=unclassified Paenibacillus TaxID=185978 RepID=UPI0036418AAF
MDHWAVLGIRRTADTTVIKKAYKQKLLVHHPEDDPAGYQRVRAAYTAAINAAKFMAKHEEVSAEAEADTKTEVRTAAEVDTEVELKPAADLTIQNEAYAQDDDAAMRGYRRLFKNENGDFWLEDSEQEEDYEDEEFITLSNHFFAEQLQVKVPAERDFIARMEQLFNDHGKRNDPLAWEELLSDDVLWDINAKSRIDGRMLRLLSEQYNLLNDQVLVMIESHMSLFDKISINREEYPARFVDTYALATQKIAMPHHLEQAKLSPEQVIKRVDVKWWKYCFDNPIGWIIIFVLGFRFVAVLYALFILVRCVLWVLRRKWKLIMWDYTFTYIDQWGKRSDFKYIDITKIVLLRKKVIIHLESKQIHIKAQATDNLVILLTRMSRYGRQEDNTIYMQ